MVFNIFDEINIKCTILMHIIPGLVITSMQKIQCKCIWEL